MPTAEGTIQVAQLLRLNRRRCQMCFEAKHPRFEIQLKYPVGCEPICLCSECLRAIANLTGVAG